MALKQCEQVIVQIKKEPSKDIKKKNKVAVPFKCLHNVGMINKLLNNFWFQCAMEAYQGACTGLVTALLIISLIRYIF